MKSIRSKIVKFFERLLERMTRLKLPIRLAILGTTFLLLCAILVLIIVGIASCAKGCGNSSEATLGDQALLLSETPDPNGNVISSDGISVENTSLPYGETDGATIDPATIEPTGTPFPTLQKRDQNERVTELQKRLMELGYLDLDETTDYFGSGTEYAVKLFQRQHELKQDGIVGAQTYTLLYSEEAQPYVLKEGAEGKDVEMVQECLVDLGYLSSSDVDGIYGQVTIDAVKAFQKRNKLTQDGKTGEKTLAKLYSDDAKVSAELEEELEAKAAAEAAKQKEQEEKESKSARISNFISIAKSKLGCEYVLGDRGPDTFDCSGFLYYCLRQAGISCKRLNASGFSQKSSWTKISDYDDVQKGDLLFFCSDESDRVSHCGIYIGSGMMIDASSANGEVVKRSVSSYWKRNFVCARRPWN